MSLKDSRSHKKRHFERRSKAAQAGLHLPTEIELFRGMPFLSEDMSVDICEFAERLSRRLKHRPKFEIAPLVAALDDLAVDQSQEAIQSVEAALEDATEFDNDTSKAARLRIQFYLASYGDASAAAVIAGKIASKALRAVRDDNDGHLISWALAWSVLANIRRNMTRDGMPYWFTGRVNQDVRSFATDFDALVSRPQPTETQEREKTPVETFRLWKRKSETQIKEPKPSKGAVIVFSSIGNVSTSEGKRVSKEFEKQLNTPIPLPDSPDLAQARTRLKQEFPYAVGVIDEMLTRLVSRDCIHLRPTILVGTPGCGKTRLARRLCEELDVPFELVSCGGMSDSALGGTPRRWSSGEPSIPVMAIRRHQCAGPVIILDEVEKVGTSRHNGNPHDVLIGLFEKETSERWFDPYVESPCDLSHVSWLMTANTLTGIPSVLLDRCRVIKFPEPGPEQLNVLAPRIVKQLYVDAGYDPRWATPLDQVEIDAIASAWPGGSIRRLYRLIEKLVELREAMQPRQ
jgi:hypothetical protein